VTKTAIFSNSRWRTASILIIALSPYLSLELTNFNQIWYADANFHSDDRHLTKKSKICKFNMAVGCHSENSFFQYMLMQFWPIYVKFGEEM